MLAFSDAFEADDMKLPDATNADAFTGADATLPVTAAMRATLPLSLRSSSRLSRTKGLAKRRVVAIWGEMGDGRNADATTQRASIADGTGAQRSECTGEKRVTSYSRTQ